MNPKKLRDARKTERPRTLVAVSEEDFALERLLDRLESWLLQQPEWPGLVSKSRATRKRVARAIADGLLLIPTRRPDEVIATRAMRRARRDLAVSEARQL